MKFIHLSDLHLGKNVCGFSMTEDQRYILRQVVETAKEKNADAVLISGDVYDRPVPPEEAVALLDDFLWDLSRIPVKVFLISGNHDSDERLNFGSRLFEGQEIYFCARFDGQLKKVQVTDEFGPVNVFLLPFVKAGEVRHYFPEAEISSYSDAVRTVIEHADIDPAERNIILAHQFVTGSSGEVRLGGSEGISAKSVGLVEQVGAGCFDAFDYAAFGHIHHAQTVGRETVRYAGTPLKYHSDEADDEKSMPLVTLGEKGSVDIELIPFRPLHDMRKIKGEMAALVQAARGAENSDVSALSMDETNGSAANYSAEKEPMDRGQQRAPSADDYIFATLTDEVPDPNAVNVLRNTFPNLMQVGFENSHTKEIAAVDTQDMEENRAFPDLIRDFYKAMYGTEIPEEELGIMKKYAAKEGVYHEAD